MISNGKNDDLAKQSAMRQLIVIKYFSTAPSVRSVVKKDFLRVYQKEMVSQNPQTMPDRKMKTMSYNAPPGGIVAFYDSTKMTKGRSPGNATGCNLKNNETDF
ncbi:MAG: hypothetical protein ACOY32_12895 [Thermodesulfobacteriota bacterium]